MNYSLKEWCCSTNVAVGKVLGCTGEDEFTASPTAFGAHINKPVAMASLLVQEKSEGLV